MLALSSASLSHQLGAALNECWEAEGIVTGVNDRVFSSESTVAFCGNGEKPISDICMAGVGS